MPEGPEIPLRTFGENWVGLVQAMRREDRAWHNLQTENWSELRHLPSPDTTYENCDVQNQNYPVDILPGKVKMRDGADPH